MTINLNFTSKPQSAPFNEKFVRETRRKPRSERRTRLAAHDSPLLKTHIHKTRASRFNRREISFRDTSEISSNVSRLRDRTIQVTPYPTARNNFNQDSNHNRSTTWHMPPIYQSKPSSPLHTTNSLEPRLPSSDETVTGNAISRKHPSLLTHRRRWQRQLIQSWQTI